MIRYGISNPTVAGIAQMARAPDLVIWAKTCTADGQGAAILIENDPEGML
jgi:hypothetical protein